MSLAFFCARLMLRIFLPCIMKLTVFFPEKYNNNLELYILDVRKDIDVLYFWGDEEIYKRVKAICNNYNIRLEYVYSSSKAEVSEHLKLLANISDMVYIFSYANLSVTNYMINLCREYNTEFLFIQHNNNF